MSELRPESFWEAEAQPQPFWEAQCHAAVDAAKQTCADARVAREAAAKTRWRARKEQLRARRLRRRSIAAGPPPLDDFVQVASVDELVDVLVLLAGRGDDDDSRHPPQGA